MGMYRCKFPEFTLSSLDIANLTGARDEQNPELHFSGSIAVTKGRSEWGVRARARITVSSVEQLEYRLIIWERALMLEDFPQRAVEEFNRIGGVDHQMTLR